MDNNYYLNLLSLWQTKGCLKSREQVILGVIKLVQSLVNKLPNRGNRDDLFQEGVLGVIKACDSYDSTNEATFLTYAKSCALYNIMDYIRKDHVIPKGSESMHNFNLSYSPVPTCHSEIESLAEIKNLPYNTVAKYAMMGTGVPFESLSQMSDEGDNVFRDVAAIEEIELIQGRLSALSVRDVCIFSQYAIQEINQKAIAATLGISKQRIHQIIKSTQNKLRV